MKRLTERLTELIEEIENGIKEFNPKTSEPYFIRLRQDLDALKRVLPPPTMRSPKEIEDRIRRLKLKKEGQVERKEQGVMITAYQIDSLKWALGKEDYKA